MPEGHSVHRIARQFERNIVGRTVSASSPQGRFVEGAQVIDIGMAGTEMLYWTVGSRDLDGGLACTASHNPKAYTGAKLVRRGAVALSGDSGIGELRELVDAGDPGPPTARTGEPPGPHRRQ